MKCRKWHLKREGKANETYYEIIFDAVGKSSFSNSKKALTSNGNT